MATGTGLLDFTAAGKRETSVAVTGQTTIAADSLIEAWIVPVATADNTIDAHLYDPPRVTTGPPSAGVGFTVYGFVRDIPQPGVPPASGPKHHGKYTVAWAWK